MATVQTKRKQIIVINKKSLSHLREDSLFRKSLHISDGISIYTFLVLSLKAFSC